MNFSGSGDMSLFVGSAIDVKGLERLDWTIWEETLDKGGVDKVSCSPAIYKDGSDNGSCSVLQSNRESDCSFRFICYEYRGNDGGGRGHCSTFLF